jgi:hypothetical protein
MSSFTGSRGDSMERKETRPNSKPTPEVPPFRLFGSMRLTVPEHELDARLGESRKAQAEPAARRPADP